MLANTQKSFAYAAMAFAISLNLELMSAGLPQTEGAGRSVGQGRPATSLDYEITPNLDDDNQNGVADFLEWRGSSFAWDDDVVAIEVPFEAQLEQVKVIGRTRAQFQVVGIRLLGSRSQVLVQGVGVRRDSSPGTLVVENGSRTFRASLRMRPFLLTSPLDRPESIFVVEVPDTLRTIKELRDTLSRIPNAPQLEVIKLPADPSSSLWRSDAADDVWIQDATEIGFFPGGRMHVALEGLRAGHYSGPGTINGVVLDKYFVNRFLAPNKGTIQVGQALPRRRWIDWFGNLEVAPPHTTARGVRFSRGRVLLGKQGRLTMQRDVLRFLEAQGVQWPPITLDTGFLMIGHVDELVNFVPHGNGFKVLVASPALGDAMLRQLAATGHGQQTFLAGRLTASGRAAVKTIDQILHAEAKTHANRKAATAMKRNLRVLREELGITQAEIVELPVFLDDRGATVWPNYVNGLVIDHHFIGPQPFGPTIDGVDPFQEFCRQGLAQIGITAHFIDAFDGYSRFHGEVHCGTNAARTPSN